jgi:hypothetical protein
MGCLDAGPCGSWTGGSVSVDALNTVVLDSLAVYDSNGNLVPSSSWSATDASGLDYTADGIVPEPGTLSLTGAFVPLILICYQLLKRRRLTDNRRRTVE